MYKLLLTWRYLLTRYIALASIISVMLGVATMIVVNAVMLGFSHEMENRVHGVLSDVTVSSRSSLRGFDDVTTRINDVWTVAGDLVEAVTPTVSTVGLLSYEVLGSEMISSQVQIVGIDINSNEKVTAISKYLQHPQNRAHLSFELREDGYNTRNPLLADMATERSSMANAGWINRRLKAKYEKFRQEEAQRQQTVYQSLPKPQSDSDPFVAGNSDAENSAQSTNPQSPQANPDAVSAAADSLSPDTSPAPLDPYEAALSHLPERPSYEEEASMTSSTPAESPSTSLEPASSPNPLSPNPLSSNPLSPNPLSSNPLSPNPLSPNPLSPNSPIHPSLTNPFDIQDTSETESVLESATSTASGIPSDPNAPLAQSPTEPSTPENSSAPTEEFPTLDSQSSNPQSSDSPSETTQSPSETNIEINPVPGPDSPSEPLASSPSSSPADDFEQLEAVPAPLTTTSPLDAYDDFQVKFDKGTQQATGIIIGMGLVSGLRRKSTDPDTGKTIYRESLTILPGDDVTLSFVSAGPDNSLPNFVYDRFTVVDFYECCMSEYDSSLVYVPIDKFQELRNMVAPDGTRMATNLLIKAKPNVRIEEIRDRLQESKEFPPELFQIETWRDSQATMLGAVATELSILNVLLFLIIAVAGFGILAIFFMIVVEKTRDIGIMKSLGASGLGVMQIFLMYSFSLGMVGTGGGLILGLSFVHYINEIAALLSQLMGHEVFDPSVYMFQRVPAIVDPTTVVWIMVGAIAIAVLSGILPALRAARLKPVDALRT